jgi:putative hydrolase of HD superfamily
MTLEQLLAAAALKDVARAGWVRAGVPAPESVAAHTWGVAWLVLAIAPPSLDRARALTYALLHDLAEARVGDLTPHDGVSREEKHRREAEAIEVLLAGRPDLAAAWADYERRADAEARFVHQLDRLDMALQADRYAEATGLDLREFLRSADAAITEPVLRRLMDDLLARQLSRAAN